MKKKLLTVVILMIICLSYFSYAVNQPNANPFGDRQFVIDKGDGVSAIAKKLELSGFLSRPITFKAYVWLTGKRASFVNGEYNLRTDLSVSALVKALTTKQAMVREETDITLVEGWTVADMDKYLADKGLIAAGELISYREANAKLEFDFLKDRPRGASLEGYIYPNTYRVYNNSGVEQIVAKALGNFNAQLTPELRADIEKQGKSIYEVVTLASLVEKEVSGWENRKKVAGVFLKRLSIGMALQADSTVNYITKSGRASSTFDDLAIDNPYNTYKYPGLPPGPICNPSIEAIEAVINPIDGGYLYFLTGTDGALHLAKTHAEHIANRKFLKK